MNYLYALQVAREGALSFLTPVFYVISEFALYGAPLLVVLLYLCVDKKRYVRMAFSLVYANFLLNTAKLIACVYRPWIRDSRLHVDPLAEHSASGYSFPSGHTTGATAFYGFLLTDEAKNKKRIWFQILMGVMILLTAFSRNWLGAHTFQDVAVAVVVPFLVIFLCNILIDYVEKNPEKDLVVMIATIVVDVVAMVYFVLKSYPIDYAADGTILCDPITVQKDSWLACGFLLAWIICWYIDRHAINFTTDVPTKVKVIRGIIGGILFAILYTFLMKKITASLDLRVGSFLRGFVTIGICAGVYPAIFTAIEKRKNK